MSNPKPEPTDAFFPREEVTDLIRELAVKPPVKGMANVKAATDVFEANRHGSDHPAEGADSERALVDATKRR